MENLKVAMVAWIENKKRIPTESVVFDAKAFSLEKRTESNWGFSDTRWACYYQAFKNLMDRLPAVLHVLREIDVDNSGGKSIDVRSLLTQIHLTCNGTLGGTKIVFHVLRAPHCDLGTDSSTYPDLMNAIEVETLNFIIILAKFNVDQSHHGQYTIYHLLNKVSTGTAMEPVYQVNASRVSGVK